MPTLAVSFYGKIVSQPDFVRINAGTFAQAGWDAWFQEGMAQLQHLGSPLPPEPVCFVLNSTRGLCAGAFAPGQDALARSFPAVLSAQYAAPYLDDLASWVHAVEPFFAAACGLALRAPQLSPGELSAHMESLGLPLSTAPGACQVLASSSLAQLSGQDDITDTAYALTTALAACADARAAKPGQPARVLALQGQELEPVQRLFWIDLVCRHLDQVLPSLLWTRSQLLLSLGPPSPSLLACLAHPGRAGSRLWPLKTSHPSARAAAIAKLSPAQAHVLTMPGASLAHVLSVFSREPL